jgi:hypothetical protein
VETSSLWEGERAAKSSSYLIGNSSPILTSQRTDVYSRFPGCLDKSKANGLSLDDISLYSRAKSNCVLRGANIQGTSEVAIMKMAGINASLDDQFEYDIAVPLPPPNRRYKVKLNIKTIKKGEPTIVDPDWI